MDETKQLRLGLSSYEDLGVLISTHIQVLAMNEIILGYQVCNLTEESVSLRTHTGNQFKNLVIYTLANK